MGCSVSKNKEVKKTNKPVREGKEVRAPSTKELDRTRSTDSAESKRNQASKEETGVDSVKGGKESGGVEKKEEEKGQITAEMEKEDIQLPCATPLKPGQKLQAPKPDNGEYVDFGAEAEGDIGGEKESVEKLDTTQEKKEEENTPSANKLPPLPMPTQRTSIRSPGMNGFPAGASRDKKSVQMSVQKTQEMKSFDSREQLRRLRAAPARRAQPHEDTLYQVNPRMPEMDFTKLH